MIHVEKTIQEAHEAFDQGQLEEAERGLRAVLEFDEDEPRALRLLGQVAMRQGDPKRAAELFQHALKAREPGSASPEGPVPTPTLAELYAEQGHTEAAIRMYRDLIARAEDDGRAERWRQRVAELEGGAEGAGEAPVEGTAEAPGSEPAGAEERLRDFLGRLEADRQVRRLREFVNHLEAGLRH